MADDPSRELIGTTMSCRRIDDLVVVVHDEELLPDDGEWRRYVEWCKALLGRYPVLKVLVLAGDKSPTSQQRSLYNQEIPGDRVRVAVLVPSRAVLMIVKIFAWFVGNIRGFERNAVDEACAYLGFVPSDEIRETLSTFRKRAPTPRAQAR